MTYHDLEKIIELGDGNVICKQFCILPNKIAECINSVAYGSQEYGYVLIGVTKDGNNYRLCGIDKHINMNNVIQNALKQVKPKTEISHQICNIEGKDIYVIKIKTCEKILQVRSEDSDKMKEVLRELLSACVKLQANAIYYQATEDQRNDYIRDILDTAGYDVKDQTRHGLSPSGKAAGEIDILIKQDDFPLTIIEALNLDSLNTIYLDKHIDKIYNYDTAGNKFNIILSYVTVADFVTFCNKYFQHIKTYDHPFKMMFIDDDIIVDDISYSDIKIMKTVHNRNNFETVLYHVCVLIK